MARQIITDARGINEAAAVAEQQRWGRELHTRLTVVLTDRAIGGDYTTGVYAAWLANHATDRVQVVDRRSCPKQLPPRVAMPEDYWP